MKTLQVSVGEFVGLLERRGDLHARFSSRSSALEGIRGHQKIQQQRGNDYQAEYLISAEFDDSEYPLNLKGRADGVVLSADEYLVEEIKTCRIDASTIPADITRLHLAQARVYAGMLVVTGEIPPQATVTLRVCYYHLDDETESITDTRVTATESQDWLLDCLTRYRDWLRRLQQWTTRRNAGVAELTFPYGEFRPGQRDMAVSVYRAFTSSQQLVLQAPTGIGKTMASIFPAVRAFTEGRLEKIFYLTAKSSGQEMARAAVSDLRAKQLPLRDVTLTARDKICFNPGAPCDPEHCEYARGYYDKMPGILNDALLQSQALTREAIESLAREHTVCPFELGLDLAVIADVVICDYNYVFDPAVYLRRFFETADDRHGLLIDEAHNLVDRGRDMFSASLQKSMFLDLRREIRTEWPLLGKQLAAVNREILALARAPQLPVDADEERSAVKPADSSGNGNRGRLQERVQDSLPDKLLNALRRLCEAFDLAFQSADHAVRHEGMLRCWFDCLRFLRVSEYFDEHYRCLITPGAAGVEGQASRSRAGDCRVQLCNINPGPLLAKAFERAGPSVCFSATMAPQHYYRTLLGVRDTAPWYGIGSPFDPDHLGVFITTFISTTYRNRNASLYDLVDLIHTIVSAQQGNYLVFAPSYAYLNEVAGKFRERYGHISVLQQTPGLTEEEQQAFTAAFREDATETLVGFAVMGGLFGEGIDLKGRRLIGVVIIGVGMPQPAAERELIREYFDQRDDQGSGFDFAYVLPGMNRVLQTAGRVIRGDDDRGIVCLVDNRFSELRYRELFPDHWQPQWIRNERAMMNALSDFWRQKHKEEVS